VTREDRGARATRGTLEVVDVEGAQLWTARSGDGPPLVLCHGGPGVWDDLGALAGLVDDVVTVHRFDQRACGRSSGDVPTGMDQAVADLEALRAHWGHEQWIVGGHSWGAGLALAYAVAHPTRVRALISIGGTGLDWADWRSQSHAAADARLTPAQRAERVRLRTALDEQRGTPAFAATARAYCRLQWSSDFADRERALARADELLAPGLLPNFKANAALQAAWLATSADAGFRRAALSLACPALFVHGEGDPRPVEALGALTALPHARLERVPGGHYPWMESPAPLRVVLRRFVADVLAG